MRLSFTYSKILKVAVPLMLGTFVQSIVMITDSAFLSRYDTLSFDASGNGGLIYVTLFMGLIGIGDAAQIIMARRIGQKNIKQLNTILQSALFMILCFSIFSFAITQTLLDNFILDYSKNKELASQQVDFLSIRSYGFLVCVLMIGLNSYFMALGKTWVIMLSSIIFALSNIILDYLLIFGVGTIPEMGIKGAALASVLSEGIAVLVLLTVLWKTKERKIHELFKEFSIKPESIKNIFKIGIPLIFQGFIALLSWTIFFIFIEQMSTYNLTISQTVRSIYFLAFIPIFGFAATTKTYIAQYMDCQDKTIIPKIIRRIQVLTILFLILIFHGAVLYPEKLVAIINPDKQYIEGSAFILKIVFGSILIYGIAMPYFQTISGSGNTRVTLLIETISISLYILYSYLAIKVWDWHIAAVWAVEYLYFILIGLLSLSYLSFFNWRKKIY